MEGTVKWFDEDKDYGFIEYDNCQDIFFHGSVIKNKADIRMYPGQLIKFDLIITCKGLQAKNVFLLKNT
jgi:CspA family cold shock protein